MTKVYTHMVMSLDGFVADPTDNPGELFEWYQAGDVAVPSATDRYTFQVDAASAELLREWTTNTGALISGRRLFDMTDGWNDSHPVGAPVVVVTHTRPDNADNWPRTTFVDGVEKAVTEAKSIAGERDVVIASPTIARQALEAGLVDEIAISLAPVLLGEGVPYFSELTRHHSFEDPTIVQGKRALHLRYAVRK